MKEPCDHYWLVRRGGTCPKCGKKFVLWDRYSFRAARDTQPEETDSSNEDSLQDGD